MKRDNIYSSWCVSRTISIGKRMFLREIPETSRLLRWLGGPTIFFSHVLFTTCDCMNSAIARCMKINIWNNTPTFESIQSSLMHCLKGLDVLLEIRAVYLQTYMYIYMYTVYMYIHIQVMPLYIIGSSFCSFDFCRFVVWPSSLDSVFTNPNFRNPSRWL